MNLKLGAKRLQMKRLAANFSARQSIFICWRSYKTSILDGVRSSFREYGGVLNYSDSLPVRLFYPHWPLGYLLRIILWSKNPHVAVAASQNFIVTHLNYQRFNCSLPMLAIFSSIQGFFGLWVEFWYLTLCWHKMVRPPQLSEILSSSAAKVRNDQSIFCWTYMILLIHIFRYCFWTMFLKRPVIRITSVRMNFSSCRRFSLSRIKYETSVQRKTRVSQRKNASFFESHVRVCNLWTFYHKIKRSGSNFRLSVTFALRSEILLSKHDTISLFCRCKNRRWIPDRSNRLFFSHPRREICIFFQMWSVIFFRIDYFWHHHSTFLLYKYVKIPWEMFLIFISNSIWEIFDPPPPPDTHIANFLFKLTFKWKKNIATVFSHIWINI